MNNLCYLECWQKESIALQLFEHAARDKRRPLNCQHMLKMLFNRGNHSEELKSRWTLLFSGESGLVVRVFPRDNCVLCLQCVSGSGRLTPRLKRFAVIDFISEAHSF